MRHWVRMFRNGGGVDPGYRRKAAFVLAVGLLTVHLRRLEKLIYFRKLRTLEIRHPPIFIIGHWRTGTTLLHNLLAQDPSLACVSTLQAFAPECFLCGGHAIEPIMSRLMPRTRPMDSVPFGTAVPQEEEFAICNMSPYSSYLGWYFPRQMPELFRKYVLFEGLSAEELADWAEVYLAVLKKATLAAQGKRLVLKNPVNTARLRVLSQHFPDARFIHIHRNPYEVFCSTLKLHRRLLEWLSFQRIPEMDVRANVLSFYREMMHRFLLERSCLPKGSFTEVRYEDLTTQPMTELAQIYSALSLPGWDQASAYFKRYIQTQHGYQRDTYDMSNKDFEEVERHWGFAIDHWGYTRPD